MSRRQRKFADIGTKRHALFFFLIYIAGAVILTFEKWIVFRIFDKTAFGFLGNAIIIFSAIALMALYVFFVTLVPATKLRTDVAADNVYYLGFLYTLTSLAIALSIDNAEAILANFGVAIVSTLIGIAARVGLNQLRVDPTDIEEASRLELADATRKVRAELHETVRQLTDFRNVSLQVLTEGYEEVQKNVENISSNVLKSVEDLVEQSTEPLNELVAKAKSANEEAVASIASVTKSNKALAKSNEDMVSQIEAVNSALAELSEHYGDTGIIDDKVINSVQEQLLKVQNQLTDKAKEELLLGSNLIFCPMKVVVLKSDEEYSGFDALNIGRSLSDLAVVSFVSAGAELIVFLISALSSRELFPTSSTEDFNSENSSLALSVN